MLIKYQQQFSTSLLANKEQLKARLETTWNWRFNNSNMLMLDLPAKQRRPWDLAMTATKMTTMMMMATMTMAITGPVPAEME